MNLLQHWYRTSYTWLTLLLLPLAGFFRLLVAVRYFFYRYVRKTFPFPVPIIVVGNLTVGGTGKTPFVIALVQYLKEQGYRPGLVSRGVGGNKISHPFWVELQTDPAVVGDEAVMLVRRTQCPLVVCVNRVAAVKELLAKTACDVVIADDGLQHYALRRDIEIVLVDEARQFGNGCMLPAGPLREPLRRLQRANFIVVNGVTGAMQVTGKKLISLHSPVQALDLALLQNKTIHAVAALGNPQRFFTLLREQKIKIIEHCFPDHYLYQAQDLIFPNDLPIVMTEKDAVKCERFALKNCWYLPVNAEVKQEVLQQIAAKLRAVINKH